MPDRTREVTATGAGSRSLGARIWAELRSRPFTYVTVLGVTLLGPVAARMIFPTEPLSLVVSGGLMLGAFFAFCALANRLFE